MEAAFSVVGFLVETEVFCAQIEKTRTCGVMLHRIWAMQAPKTAGGARLFLVASSRTPTVEPSTDDASEDPRRHTPFKCFHTPNGAKDTFAREEGDIPPLEFVTQPLLQGRRGGGANGLGRHVLCFTFPKASLSLVQGCVLFPPQLLL